MGVPVLLLLASMLVPVAHESWALEVDRITSLADHAPLTRQGDLDKAAQLAAELGPRPDLRQRLRNQGLSTRNGTPMILQLKNWKTPDAALAAGQAEPTAPSKVTCVFCYSADVICRTGSGEVRD